MVDSARFLFVNKKLTNGVRSAAANGDGPPNQCKGSDENRGHALSRVWNTSLVTALDCRIHFHSGKPVKGRRFLVLGTLPRGTALRFVSTEASRLRSGGSTAGLSSPSTDTLS